MTRKMLTAGAVLLAGGLLLHGLTGPAAAGGKKDGAGKAPPYVHGVFFYLKKDAPADEADALVKDSHALLGKIPTVRKLWAGRPADMATPMVADKEYGVGLVILFDDYDGLQTYLEHKLHLEFIDRHGKHWERVAVYDFLNAKK